MEWFKKGILFGLRGRKLRLMAGERGNFSDWRRVLSIIVSLAVLSNWIPFMPNIPSGVLTFLFVILFVVLLMDLIGQFGGKS
jgi:hypothetical protein